MRHHRLIFVAILIVWTWLLLKPNPVPEFIDDSLSKYLNLKYLLSKCVHVGSYAFLAWFGTFRLPSPRWKWIWLGLVLHGALTEVGQYYGNLYFETNRHGCVQDVLIDSAGIALGAWWRSRSR